MKSEPSSRLLKAALRICLFLFSKCTDAELEPTVSQLRENQWVVRNGVNATSRFHHLIELLSLIGTPYQEMCVAEPRPWEEGAIAYYNPVFGIECAEDAAAGMQKVHESGGKALIVIPKRYLPTVASKNPENTLSTIDIFLPRQPGQQASSSRGKVKLVGAASLLRASANKAKEAGLQIFPTTRIEKLKFSKCITLFFVSSPTGW